MPAIAILAAVGRSLRHYTVPADAVGIQSVESSLDSETKGCVLFCDKT